MEFIGDYDSLSLFCLECPEKLYKGSLIIMHTCSKVPCVYIPSHNLCYIYNYIVHLCDSNEIPC